MFNAVNILEALKNYIHTRGGQSSANNIAEAVNDLNSIPQGSGGISEAPIDGKQYARKDGDWSEVQSSGGDIPDEVTNAVETNGMGWTDEDETVHQIDEKYIPSPSVIIETTTNATVSGYQVPNPTVEQVTAAYNAVVSARPCTLTDALGKQHFVVNQADIVGDTISISVLYYMEMILTYSIENDAVVITHYDIGSVE